MASSRSQKSESGQEMKAKLFIMNILPVSIFGMNILAGFFV